MTTTSPHKTSILLLLCVAQLIISIDFSIVNVALPAIQADLAMSDAALQWVITAFAVCFGGLLMLGGRAGDLYGRRRCFVIGLWLFAASCLAAGLAQSGAMLLAARGVQGEAGALVAPAALSLLTTSFTLETALRGGSFPVLSRGATRPSRRRRPAAGARALPGRRRRARRGGSGG
jgi:MFS family permease